MVTSGTHVNNGCCFDYGNSETDRKADTAGAMDAIYFGTSCWFRGVHRNRPLGAGRPRMGTVLWRKPHLEPQPACFPQPICHCYAQEQRHDPNGDQGRECAIGKADHAVQRVAAQRVQPDEATGGHRSGQWG